MSEASSVALDISVQHKLGPTILVCLDMTDHAEEHNFIVLLLQKNLHAAFFEVVHSCFYSIQNE